MSVLKQKRVLAAVIVIAAIAIAALLLVGQVSRPGAPKVRVKDVLVIGTTVSIQTTLDPAEAYDYLGVNIIQNLGEGLFSYEPGTAKLVNALAVSYTVSPDRRI
ncbi:MAG: hypothetical protein QXS92_04175 [Thermofilum sp.]